MRSQLQLPRDNLMRLTAAVAGIAVISGCTSIGRATHAQSRLPWAHETAIAFDGGDNRIEVVRVMQGESFLWALSGRRLSIDEGLCMSSGPVFRDLTGDDVPDLVVRSFEEGAHAGCQLTVVSCFGPRDVRVVAQIRIPDQGQFFDIDGDRAYEIITTDDALDYFDGAPFSDSPKPLVVLRLDGSRYVVSVADAHALLSAHGQSWSQQRSDDSGWSAAIVAAELIYSGDRADADVALRRLGLSVEESRALIDRIVAAMEQSPIGTEVLAWYAQQKSR